MTFIVYAIFAGFVTLSFVFKSWVLLVLWDWFIIPVFHLPQLTLVTAMGLALFSAYLTAHYSPDVVKNGDKKEQALHLLKAIVLKPVITLCVAWLIKKWL